MMLNYFFEMYYLDSNLISSDNFRILLSSILAITFFKKIQFSPDSIPYTMKTNVTENIVHPRECF